MNAVATSPVEDRAGDPIAIVGIGAVFPDASTLDDFGTNLSAGHCAIRPVSEDRRRFTGAPVDGRYPMAALDRVDLFDRGFFAISPAESTAMDPHHRIALQLAWHAAESAAVRPSRLQSETTGVFLSSGASRYGNFLDRQSSLAFVGTAPSGAAGRISHHLGLAGPCLAVDTGCSGSLVAVGLAVDALRCRRCRFALAGGVSVRVDFPPPDASRLSEVMSRDGYCRAFDAAADGTADGEGGAILLLERLSDALADGHRVLAVIRSVSVNHNGDRSVGMTAPSVDAQIELLTDAWRNAALDLSAVRFIEAHGSGTRLGDAIELTALDRALRSYGPGAASIPVGSVKSNIGHLDHAAGMAGLCKAVIGLRTGTVFPTLHFEQLNPAADVSGDTVRIAHSLERYPAASGQVALVSSFGITGVNAHAVIEAAPKAAAIHRTDPEGPTVVTLSARSSQALGRYRSAVAQALDEPDRTWDLVDVAATLNRGREDLPVRWAAVADSVVELVELLRSEDGADGWMPPVFKARPVVAVFPHFEPADPALMASWYRALAGFGVVAQMHVATGNGHHALSELGRAVPGADPESPFDPAALRALAAQLSEKEPIYLVFGEESPLGGVLVDTGCDIVTVTGRPDSRRDCAAIAARLYRLGANPAWPDGEGRPGSVDLPFHPFIGERCWPTPPGVVAPFPVPAAVDAIGPATPEDVLASVEESVRSLLDLQDLGPDPDYFALGGNSLLALELLTRIERQFGTTISLPDLYQHAGLADLAGLVISRAGAGDSHTDDGIRACDDLEWPLSFGQESLLFFNELDADTAVYNVTADLRLTGTLHVDALRRALERLVHRHVVLAGRYEKRADGTFMVVDPRMRVELPIHQVPPGTPEERDAWVAAETQRIALRPYDLAAGPLHRFALLRFDDNDNVLIFGSHHSVDDGWSPAIVDHELTELYAAEVSGLPVDLPDLPISYGDFARWQRNSVVGPQYEAGIAFWRDYLAGCQAADLAADRPRPARLSDRGEHVELRLTAAQAMGLRAMARKRRCTTFVVALAVLEAALFRYSRTGDFAVGVVVSGRERPETRGLIGYFNNMVPIRAVAEPDASFHDLIDRVRDSFLTTVPYHGVPFVKIVEALNPLRDLGSHPLFQVGFTYQNIPRLEGRLGGVAGRPDVTKPYLTGLPPARAPWDLNLTLWEIEGLDDFKLVFEFASDLFDRATGRHFADEFVALLDELLRCPDTRMSVLMPVPTGGGEAASEVSGACFPYKGDDEEGVLETIARIAATDPGRVAVLSPDGGLDYRELVSKVRSFRSGLRRCGVRAGDTVALLAGRRLETVVAMLGTWAAGAAFAPIDPAYPSVRIRAMLDIAQPVIVVADEGPVPETASPTMKIADIPVAAEDGEPISDGGDVVPKWLIFTSGSTGRPKGVMVGGAAIGPFVSAWRGLAERAGVPLRVLSTASPAFDVFTGDLIRAFATGGALVVVPPEQTGTGADLGKAILQYEVNTAELIPAQLCSELVGWLTDHDAAAGSLRLVINGLSSWTGRDKARLLERCGAGASAVTIFGITEAVIDDVADLTPFSPALEDDAAPGPVGLPFAGNAAYVLDPTMRPVPRGAVGELYLGGRGLAFGYLGDGSGTAARFVPDPFSGEPGARMYATGDRMRRRSDNRLDFLGRMDRQLKVNGARVEPGDVEAALRTHPAVKAAHVGLSGDSGSSQLTAWAATGESIAPTPLDLRKFLLGLLPRYAIPSRYVLLPELPLTGNGKIDVAALPAVTEDGEKGLRSGPRTDTEFELAVLFGETLQSGPLGIHDDFFQVGGSSLDAVRVVAAIKNQWGVRVPLSKLFQTPTVAEIAALVDRGQTIRPTALLKLASGSGTPLVLCEPSGGTSFCYAPLARSLSPARPVVGLQSAGIGGDQPPQATMDEIVDHHLAALAAAGVDGPLVVSGWSHGGVVAHALAARLISVGVPVALTVLLDAAPRVIVPRRLPRDDFGFLSHLLRTNFGFSAPAGVAESGDPFAALLAAAQAAGLYPAEFRSDDVSVMLAVHHANEDAADAYRPGPLPGELLLLRTAEGPEPEHNRREDLGWSEFTSDLSVRMVPGDHATVVPVEYAELGRQLSAELLARGL
ncbi:MAG: hypothetical protein AUG49_11800 [Catenulispora sp. 13_1_20CM_3_70_7]|nr:MAG: hypothetical protein AUG49_11800 [Catenulispora sp. 13_1_20CM_3_70_7]